MISGKRLFTKTASKAASISLGSNLSFSAAFVLLLIAATAALTREPRLATDMVAFVEGEVAVGRLALLFSVLVLSFWSSELLRLLPIRDFRRLDGPSLLIFLDKTSKREVVEPLPIRT